MVVGRGARERALKALASRKYLDVTDAALCLRMSHAALRQFLHRHPEVERFTRQGRRNTEVRQLSRAQVAGIDRLRAGDRCSHPKCTAQADGLVCLHPDRLTARRTATVG